MLRPRRMKRVDLVLLKDDAPRAALLLADNGSFAPELTEVEPESLPELPREEFRRAYQTSKTHLDRILAHFGSVPPV